MVNVENLCCFQTLMDVQLLLKGVASLVMCVGKTVHVNVVIAIYIIFCWLNNALSDVAIS